MQAIFDPEKVEQNKNVEAEQEEVEVEMVKRDDTAAEFVPHVQVWAKP